MALPGFLPQPNVQAEMAGPQWLSHFDANIPPFKTRHRYDFLAAKHVSAMSRSSVISPHKFLSVVLARSIAPTHAGGSTWIGVFGSSG